jgi:tRNA modification GTPase
LSTKESITALLNKLEKILDANTHTDDMTLISKRQIIAVEQTLNHIVQALNPLQTGELEFFAYHINEALAHISNITRPYEHTEMLDVMFGEFCLGK